MWKNKIILFIMLLITILGLVACGGNDNSTQSIKSIEISIDNKDNKIYIGEKIFLSVSVDNILSNDELEFCHSKPGIIYVGKNPNGSYYVKGSDVGETMLYVINKNNPTVKSNSITFNVVSSRDIHLCQGVLGIGNGVIVTKQTEIVNNRHEEYKYPIAIKGISGANNSFFFTSSNSNLSNILIDEVDHNMGLWGSEVIYEIVIELKETVVNPGKLFGVKIIPYLSDGTDVETYEFEFENGARTSRIMPYSKGEIIEICCLEKGVNIEIENIYIDIKWFNNGVYKD